MTQQAHSSTELVGNGFTFEAALSDLLTATINLFSPVTDGALPDHSVRIRAEAATQEALVDQCLEAILARIDEFDAQPIAITLDGLRPIDRGYRAWGSLYLNLDREGPAVRLELQSQPIVQIREEHYEITIIVNVRRFCD